MEKKVRFERVVSSRGCFHARLTMGINNESHFTYTLNGLIFETIATKGKRANKTFISLFCAGLYRIKDLPDNKTAMGYSLIYEHSEN